VTGVLDVDHQLRAPAWRHLAHRADLLVAALGKDVEADLDHRKLASHGYSFPLAGRAVKPGRSLSNRARTGRARCASVARHKEERHGTRESRLLARRWVRGLGVAHRVRTRA